MIDETLPRPGELLQSAVIASGGEAIQCCGGAWTASSLRSSQ
jgi:hypothetical protein